MSDKITWWPAAMARDIIAPQIVLMRYDWPDGKRIYEIGIYDPAKKFAPWTLWDGNVVTTPDYFMYAGNITEFIDIPADREYTYGAQDESAH